MHCPAQQILAVTKPYAANTYAANSRMEEQWKHQYIFLQDFWKAEKLH